MRTAVGLFVVAVILVGFPLLAVTVGRRLPVPNPRPPVDDADLWLARSLGVTGVDHLAVVQAVTEGRQVEPRLRCAAVAYATRLALQEKPKQQPRRRGWLLRIWVAVIIAGVASLFLLRFSWSLLWNVFFYIVVGPVVMVSMRRRRRQRIERSIELNNESVRPNDGGLDTQPEVGPQEQQ